MTYTSQWLSTQVEARSKELTATATSLAESAPQLSAPLLQFSKQAQTAATDPKNWNEGKAHLKKQMLHLNGQLLGREKTLKKRFKKAQSTASTSKHKATVQAATARKAELELALTLVSDVRFAFRMLAICFPVFELSSRLHTLEGSFESGEIELAYDRRQDARLLIARIRTAVQSLRSKALKSAPIGCTLLPSLIEQGCCSYWGKGLPNYVKPFAKPLHTIEQLAPNPRIERPSNYRLRECRVDEIEVVDV